MAPTLHKMAAATAMLVVAMMATGGDATSGKEGSKPAHHDEQMRQARQRGYCIDIHQLAHGQATCSRSGCRLRCVPGYNFIASEKRRTVTLNCDQKSGKLWFRDRVWVPEMTICTPICNETCRNGGTCVAPNKCECRAPFSGDYCEGEPMLGDQPYEGFHPSGGLESNQRRVVCDPGSRMPDGSTSVTLTYKDNTWFYPNGKVMLGVDQVTCEKESGVLISDEPQETPTHHQPEDKPRRTGRPDPIREALTAPRTHFVVRRPALNNDNPTRILNNPTTRVHTFELTGSHSLCSSPCQNGGQCVLANTCSCPDGFWGPQCQESTCTYPRFEGAINSRLAGTSRRLEFECSPGSTTLAGRNRVEAMCSRGVWRLPGGGLLTEADVSCLQRQH